MALNMSAFKPLTNASKCYAGSRFDKRNIPGNFRFLSGLIRFHKELEAFACDAGFIRGIEKIWNPKTNTEVLWICGSFGSFPKVSPSFDQIGVLPLCFSFHGADV